jgi:hypothetical protein
MRDAQDPSRRACQTVIAELLSGLLAAVAPLVPHMAEDASVAEPALQAGACQCVSGGLAAAAGAVTLAASGVCGRMQLLLPACSMMALSGSCVSCTALPVKVGVCPA